MKPRKSVSKVDADQVEVDKLLASIDPGESGCDTISRNLPQAASYIDSAIKTFEYAFSEQDHIPDEICNIIIYLKEQHQLAIKYITKRLQEL